MLFIHSSVNIITLHKSFTSYFYCFFFDALHISFAIECLLCFNNKKVYAVIRARCCDPACSTHTRYSYSNGCGNACYQNATTIIECICTCSPGECIIEDTYVYFIMGLVFKLLQLCWLTLKKIIIIAVVSLILSITYNTIIIYVVVLSIDYNSIIRNAQY